MTHRPETAPESVATGASIREGPSDNDDAPMRGAPNEKTAILMSIFGALGADMAGTPDAGEKLTALAARWA